MDWANGSLGDRCLQFAEQTVRSLIHLRDHILQRSLLRFGQRELRGDLAHIRLHQVGLRGGQLGLLAGYCAQRQWRPG